MKLKWHNPSPIRGLMLIETQSYDDRRGTFFENYRDNFFKKTGIKRPFVQENVSISHKNVLRGLHFQKGADAQAKLITVLQGSVYDVVVDLRPNSPTHYQWYSIRLSSIKRELFYIPRGFAHGFLSLEDNTIVQYKCDSYYSCKSEAFYRFDEPLFNIHWPIKTPILSPKDSGEE